MAKVKPLILFVSPRNTGCSHMAEAFLRRFVGNAVDVASVGTEATERPDPNVVAVMRELGFDISKARSKLLSPEIVARAERVIVMGCDIQGLPRNVEGWRIPDPKGESRQRVREIRDLTLRRVAALAKSLSGD